MSQRNNIHKLSVQASTNHLHEVRDFVASYAVKMGFPKEDVDDIRLAVDEAYTNIIKHAYNYDNTQSVEIILKLNDNEFHISLLDYGKTFDPTSYHEPNLKKQIKEKKRGGVGVYLMKKLMDKIEYRKRGQRNEIRMVKKL